MMISEENVAIDTDKTLWCITCQSGIGKLANKGVYSEGDICPLCLKKGRGDRSDTLTTVAKATENHLKKAAFIKEEARKKALKGIKSADANIKELQQSYEARNRALENEIKELKEIVQSGSPLKETEPIKPVTEVKTSSKQSKQSKPASAKKVLNSESKGGSHG